MKTLIDRVQQGDRFFRWRGGDVSRLEALFDMVLALALTLTAISTEVPADFGDLTDAFWKLPSFAICFGILLMCWYYHFQFHRRYGLENFPLVIMSGILLFIIISYVYPLKFLYSLLLDSSQMRPLTPAEGQRLIVYYSGGFAAIFCLFFLMTAYAFAHRVDLELTRNERVLTQAAMGTHAIYFGVGLLSTVMALTGLGGTLAGWVYVLIGPLQFANGLYWGRLIDERVAERAD